MTLADRLIDLNRWYEALPDGRRVFVYPAVLVAAGFVNTRLTGSPIGWVSVSALAALVAARRSYVSGWLASRVPAGGPVAAVRPRAAAETVAPAALAKPEPVRPIAAVAPKPEPVVPVAVERQPAAPAAPVHAPVIPPAAAPVAAQPIARAAPEQVAPVEVPAPKPVARVEAATATPPAPAHDNHAKGGKRGNTPPGRKQDGKSGKRKPGDKHP
jgi:hypothetical protein